MKRFVSLLVLSLAGLAAHAQTAPTVPATATANWTNPTHTECVAPPPQGSSECVRLLLNGAYAVTGIQVFVSTAPIADNSNMGPTATVAPGTNTYEYTGTVPNGSTLYVRTKAVNAFGPSPTFSNQASKLVMVEAKPGPPTNLTISVTVTLPQ